MSFGLNDTSFPYKSNKVEDEVVGWDSLGECVT